MSDRPALEIETLESRCLAVGVQDAVELWWRINLLRSLSTEGLARLSLSSSSLVRQTLAPLAWNAHLRDSAQAHAMEMSGYNYFAHQSEVDSRWPNKMVRDQGYPLPQSLPNDRNDVESIFAGETFSEPDTLLADILKNDTARAQLFPSEDSSVLSTEIGIGCATDSEATFDHYWALHVAGRREGERFITGVVYEDRNNNDLFDANEGMTGIRIETGELSTTTNTQGIYSLAVAGGRHRVNFYDQENRLLASTMLTIGERSVAIDLQTNDAGLEINFRRRSWWTNAENHVDVNRDRLVNAMDALVIINQLNRTGVQSLGEPTSNTAYPSHATDTNGDSYLNATDALVVINYLNRG
jgi:hypothetical protein